MPTPTLTPTSFRQAKNYVKLSWLINWSFNPLSTKMQATKYTSAKSEIMFCPSYITLRIQRPECKQHRSTRMSPLIRIYSLCYFSYFCLWHLTLLHSERPKLPYSFGISECNRVKLYGVSAILSAIGLKC